jgi:hypothetical protein
MALCCGLTSVRGNRGENYDNELAPIFAIFFFAGFMLLFLFYKNI